MNQAPQTDRFVKDPSLLVELCREVTYGARPPMNPRGGWELSEEMP
jgi:hypothetical protein